MAQVILITGPAGAGKTTLATYIGQQPGWTMYSEDAYWARLPRDPHLLRTDAEKALIQAQVVVDATVAVRSGSNVVIEFILYEDPPQPLLFYQQALALPGVVMRIGVLRPPLATIMARQAQRGNDHDTQLSEEMRRANAEHQLRCLQSHAINPAWIIDNSALSAEAVWQQL
ncbi:MAG: hypothetical protein RL076_2706 [Chloroflexota bacterium]|jgi:adenylate kinase family enzyme